MIQAGPTPVVVRGDRSEIVVPQGWKVARLGTEVAIEHATGASLLVRRPVLRTAERNLDSLAEDAVERIMAPLGFAKFEKPRRFKNGGEESVQYEIRGNRLSERRRLLYRAIRHDRSVFEIVYEHSEDRFDVLLSEAQAIASSLQSILENPPQPDRRRR